MCSATQKRLRNTGIGTTLERKAENSIDWLEFEQCYAKNDIH